MTDATPRNFPGWAPLDPAHLTNPDFLQPGELHVFEDPSTQYAEDTAAYWKAAYEGHVQMLDDWIDGMRAVLDTMKDMGYYGEFEPTRKVVEALERTVREYRQERE